MTVRELFYPRRCCACMKVLLPWESGFCDACKRQLPWVEEGKIQAPLLPHELRCAAPLWYEEGARQAVLRLKFREGSWVADILGVLLAECAASYCAGDFDCVTWVPVGRKRLRQRGFDQAQLLAACACRLWETEPVAMLRKVTDNPPQSGIQDPAARRANVLGVYDPINTDKILRSRILLVDDVCTTGATLEECARVLMEAGAADVTAVTVAKTREREEHTAACSGNTQEKRTNHR